jgi:hypothetical protein
MTRKTCSWAPGRTFLIRSNDRPDMSAPQTVDRIRYEPATRIWNGRYPPPGRESTALAIAICSNSFAMALCRPEAFLNAGVDLRQRWTRALIS